MVPLSSFRYEMWARSINLHDGHVIKYVLFLRRTLKNRYGRTDASKKSSDKKQKKKRYRSGKAGDYFATS